MISDIFSCDCQCEGIVLGKDGECNEVHISLWTRGLLPNQTSLKWKLQLIWKIITTGIPYTDQICLDYETALKLSQRLKELAK
jgi:hypothetical protein